MLLSVHVSNMWFDFSYHQSIQYFIAVLLLVHLSDTGQHVKSEELCVFLDVRINIS